MANLMQESVFLPKLQYFKDLKLVFLNIYNYVWKPGFLKFSYILVSELHSKIRRWKNQSALP